MSNIHFRRRRKSGRISLVPMIDVLCCLLIFFMLSTQFVRWGALDIQVASHIASVSRQDKKLEPIKLYLSIDRVRLHQAELTLSDLVRQLKDHTNTRAGLNQLDIRLFVSKKTQLQFTVDVVEKLQQLGIKKIKFEKNNV
ncbi:protein TolR [Piscirickettsia salmonis]|uniref:Biopolymer transporter ExbD n=2 Tax=Piscirickettsia salmonis TaxID=1238 RepID=A0AAC9EUV9_PISSA|nr:biopolymer transporter ExbD [Piscirickettsia salmonis]ALB22578.1 biopolymer transporter ExbD [Piscirickettsia salmonis]QGN98813.1 protein TolR [Piscirickettsia salmonis]QGO02439.1 protein TolR [Piscirickettsia salmonis]QGO13114.1 protein TolR [Piscirickettsia salmonis]QGO20167.1 protein TolR [Piscirickettsia salmonis]